MKPPARMYHAAIVISDAIAGQNPLVMVVGGMTNDSAILSDVWLLNMTDGTWSEV